MNEHKAFARIVPALVDLMRVRILVMVLISCAIGFILAYQGGFSFIRLFWTLFGTALLSGGSCTLNCYVEREWDALMPRTCRRPIPAGTIAPVTALVFGLGLVVAGCVTLGWKINMLAGFLGLTAVLTYVAIYTPSKRLTWLNTSIGAIPGAIPPLIGWAAAKGQIDPGGWVLFAMLFLWQHTHFFPIAWLYRDDYQKGGFRMLPVLNKGELTFVLTILSAVVLLPISLLLYGFNLAGYVYLFGAAFLGIVLIAGGFRWRREPSRPAARMVLLLSLCYLPLILVTVVVDRYGAQLGSYLQRL